MSCLKSPAKGGNMIIEKVVVGPLEENSYIVADEVSKEALIIDPGDGTYRQ
jgi:glyoxylase-like metal-dependent hydrolase (beta-lactamase superfamily II)